MLAHVFLISPLGYAIIFKMLTWFLTISSHKTFCIFENNAKLSINIIIFTYRARSICNVYSTQPEFSRVKV